MTSTLRPADSSMISFRRLMYSGVERGLVSTTFDRAALRTMGEMVIRAQHGFLFDLSGILHFRPIEIWNLFAADKQSDQGNRSWNQAHIPKTEHRLSPSHRGHNEQIDVQKTSEKDRCRHRHENCRVFLGTAEQQDHKRHSPVQNQICQKQSLPGTLLPQDKVFCFFRIIDIPDEHVLAEPDVHPEAAE